MWRRAIWLLAYEQQLIHFDCSNDILSDDYLDVHSIAQPN